MSTGSSKAMFITPEFRSKDVNSANTGDVVSGVKVLAGTGLIPSTAG